MMDGQGMPCCCAPADAVSGGWIPAPDPSALTACLVAEYRHRADRSARADAHYDLDHAGGVSAVSTAASTRGAASPAGLARSFRCVSGARPPEHTLLAHHGRRR